ncbi:MAG: hypothetical protein WCT47_12105 [Betaproteobacteria bacterium]
MNKLQTSKVWWACACLVTLPVAHAANISNADYTAGKARISTGYKTDRATCDSQSGNAKDICVQEAKAKEKVALAELEYSHTGKPGDRNKVFVARAESAYAVAKERCDDLAGNAKDVCVKEAKAVEIKALADAKMGKEIGDARQDAAAEKLDADYKVAIEKCDALAGDAKNGCVAAAKARFGRN